MKAKVIFFILVVVSTMFVLSCDNGSKATNPQNATFNSFEDIDVPANFNFETKKVIDLEFYAPNKGTVVVIGDDGVEYYRALADDIEPIQRSISIPSTVTSLDFHYRNMVFSDYFITDLINNPEVYLYNIEEVDEKSASKKEKTYVIPILEGIELEDDGSITSHWGYNNEFSYTYIQEIGPKNKFTGSGLNSSNLDQGQPTEFLPGRHYDVFVVNFTPIGNDCITWSLQTSNRLHQDACANSPLYPGDDTDNDGVLDENDAYPTDPNKAYVNIYPNEETIGTLLFEDLWPDKGDYDFNDMVVRYRIEEILSATNHIKEIRFDILLAAIGATKQNGLYFELPFQAEDVTVTSAYYPDYTYKTNDTGLAIIQVFNNSNDFYPLNGEFMNTVQTDPFISTTLIHFEVEVSGEYSASESAFFIPYNPFITIDHDRSKEVHLPGLPPTSNADPSYFNNEDFDDATDIEAGYYYKTAEGAPWAIDVPFRMSYPTENTGIVKAYPEFGKWVESGGTAFTNWYENPDLEHVYFELIFK